jgi:RNA polymerase sigma-70 factor (ECF subfamily)
VALPPGELAALRRRDEQVLNRVVHEHSPRLFRAARALGHSTEEAEDLVQEVFLTFVATLDRFEGRASVHTWLYGILLRKAKERWRERAKEETHDAIDGDWESRFDPAGNWVRPPVDPDRALTTREASAAIQDCFRELPPHQRSALLLRQFEGFSAEEASKVLDLTVTHIGVLLHRARLRMRACLDVKGWRTNSR